MTEMTTSPVIPPETLGWRLRRALDFAGIGVEELADELEVSRKTVGNWAHDRNRPSPTTLKVIALRLGVPHEWLKDGATVPFNAAGETDPPVTRRYPRENRHPGVVAA